jgi:hypothetical protein
MDKEGWLVVTNVYQRFYEHWRNSSTGFDFLDTFPEAIVHRMLSYGWRPDGSAPQPIPMVSNESNPPTFSATFPTGSSSLCSFTPDTSVSALAPLRAGTQAVTRVDFTDELSNMTLDNDKYYTYMPTTATPLFDSFTIHLDLDRHTAIVSVFKTTTSPRYEGSAEGYPLIRKIMARVRGLLEGAGFDATVKVTYFLVCPEDEDRSQRRWQMPVCWNNNFGAHSHRGNAFCVRVPTRTLQYVVPLTSNFVT